MTGIILVALLSLPSWEFRADVTAYTSTCTGCTGVTASGRLPVEGRTLSCPSRFLFGTRVELRGVGEFVCEDRGGAIHDRGARPVFDLYFDTRHEAIAFGRRTTWGRVAPEKEGE